MKTSQQTQRSEWLSVIAVVVVWRVALVVIAMIAGWFFVYAPSFPYADVLANTYQLPLWVQSWANFDGVHYWGIAENGYKFGLTQAFFPLFPLIISMVGQLNHNTLTAGLFISQLSLIAMCLAWFGFVSELAGKSIARWSLVFLLTFPTAFFFGALYSESLFVCLVILTFWAAHRKNWWLAGVVAAFASATRIVGVLLVPALLVELAVNYWQAKNGKFQLGDFVKTQWLNVIGIGVGSSGLLAYMVYLYVYYQDPLYFFHVQSEFGAGRQETLILYPQVVWRYIKILITYRPIDWKYFAYVQEFLVSTIGFGVLLWLLNVMRKNSLIKPSHLLFSLGAFLVPTLTGTFSSMPRYVLVCFPVFLYLSQVLEKKPLTRALWIAISVAVLILNTMLFIQGYWVA